MRMGNTVWGCRGPRVSIFRARQTLLRSRRWPPQIAAVASLQRRRCCLPALCHRTVVAVVAALSNSLRAIWQLHPPPLECYLLRGEMNKRCQMGSAQTRSLSNGHGMAHSFAVGGRSQISGAYLVWIAHTISSSLLCLTSPASTKDLPIVQRWSPSGAQHVMRHVVQEVCRHIEFRRIAVVLRSFFPRCDGSSCIPMRQPCRPPSESSR
ncbi:hypothetical protein V1278_000158 [Bradyrhizobium sp. AZCC 1577]